ncbi:hypothetical protein Q6247_25150, partial [Klebsiella pneumoniae]
PQLTEPSPSPFLISPAPYKNAPRAEANPAPSRENQRAAMGMFTVTKLSEGPVRPSAATPSETLPMACCLPVLSLHQKHRLRAVFHAAAHVHGIIHHGITRSRISGPDLSCCFFFHFVSADHHADV